MIVKRCLIIDDSEEVIYTLSSVLSEFPFLEVLSANSFESALELLISDKVDLVFLDIDLEGKNGLNLLKFLSEPPPTIVISSSPEYAVQTYDIDNVVGFFTKPIDYTQLSSDVGNILSLKIVKTGFIGSDYCLLKVGTKMIKLNFDYIDYIEGYGMYCKIHCEAKIIVATESMSTMQNNLPHHVFKRIHKSYIININKIQKINHQNCTINNKTIPIGYSYKPHVDPLIKSFKSITNS